MTAVMRLRVDEIADAVGRLRAMLAEEQRVGYLLDRIAASASSLDVMLAPTAAESYRWNLAAGMPDDEALAAALDDAERQGERFRVLLRERRR